MARKSDYRAYKMVDYRNRTVKYGITKRPIKQRERHTDRRTETTLAKRRATDTYLNTKLTRMPQRG